MTDRTSSSWFRATAVVGAAAAVAAVAVTGVGWARDRTTGIRDAGASAINESFIVILRPGAVLPSGVAAMADRLAARHQGTVRRTWGDALLGFEVSMRPDGASRLQTEPGVAYVEKNEKVYIADTQDDPPSYGLDRIDERSQPLNGSFTFPTTASNVHVYVIDSGIRTSHRDFGGRAESGFDAVDGGDADDCSGHGTHVAGTIGGSQFGVAKDAKLVAVRVVNCNGVGSLSEVLAGVNFVTRNAVRPAVANMSLGGIRSRALQEAVANSIRSGVTYVVAAGNEDADACVGALPRVRTAITVGATDRRDRRASFSNFGECVDIFAPGTRITSAWNGSDRAIRTVSGTSMASPHVAGAAALILGTNPDFSPGQVSDALLESATENVVDDAGDGSANRLLFVSQ
jgi:subtilisin family serine protease